VRLLHFLDKLVGAQADEHFFACFKRFLEKRLVSSMQLVESATDGDGFDF
jgi:hypothetical protein